MPRLAHPANQAGGRSNIIWPPGKRSAHAAINPSASSGWRYISRPSAVMNTPCFGGTRSIQLKSSADWREHLDTVGWRQQLAPQVDHRRADRQ